jgi:alpha-tubulin suppressor-like RCC1 family protein
MDIALVYRMKYRITPNSSVAATIPKMIAARMYLAVRFWSSLIRPRLRHSDFLKGYCASRSSSSRRRCYALLLLCSALALSSCERATAPDLLVYSDRPIAVPATARGWTSVTVGGEHTCGIRLDGTLQCWGGDASGQLGVGGARGKCGRRNTACEGGPRAVSSTLHFSAVSAGQSHTCAISTDRALFCWGENVQFQAGVEREVMLTKPAAVAPGLQFIDVGAGATHTCAVRTNGIVYCWGEGTLGALGRGDTITSVIPAPIATTQHFVVVRSGRLRSCAIATDASTWCWGSEWEGSDGAFDFFHTRTTPHRIDGLPPVRDISVSSSSICAVTLDGVSYCWEGNTFGQLGTGTVTGTATPVTVLTPDRFTSISAGVIQTCATSVNGIAQCWGNNSFGQLGVPRPGEHCTDAFLECSREPVGVFGLQRFRSVATGLGNHTCGVSEDGAMLCWGLGSEGQLGDGFTRDRQSLPVPTLAPSP